MIARYRVRSLHCSQEAGLIQQKLASLPGIDRVSFELLDEELTVECQRPADVEAAVRSLGLGIEPWTPENGAPTKGPLLLSVLSGLAMLAGLATETSLSLLPTVSYAIAVLAGAWHVVPKAWRALANRHLDMNVLVLIALAGATALGEYTEAASLAFLFSIANVLESWSIRRAAKAIRRAKSGVHAHHHRHLKGLVPAGEPFIQRFVRWYTPAVLTLGALAMLSGRPEFALMILLTACPCALVISAPVTIAAALGSAGRHGAFVPHALVLEQAAASDEALEMLIGQHQVVLSPEDDRRFRFLRHHAIRTMRTLKLNVAIAVGTKLAFLAMAAAGRGALWMAIASDLGATLVVTLIGLRLLTAVEPSPLPVRAQTASAGD